MLTTAIPARTLKRRAGRRTRSPCLRLSTTSIPARPMGANLIADGATFRVWAPQARGGARDRRLQRSGAQRRQPAHSRRARPLARLHPRRARSRALHVLRGRRRQRRARSAIPTPASCRRPFPATASSARPTFRWHESRLRHAAVSRFRHLSAPRRHVLHAEPAAQRRHVSRRRAQDPVPGRTRRHGAPAPADPGVPDAASASATTAPTISRPRWISPWRMRTSRRTSRR